MELLLPQLGLFFWTLVIFLLFFFILRKYAWKPILKAVQDREKTIETALGNAETARKELEEITQRSEVELKAVREERQRIVSEAEENKRQILVEAQEKAREEASRRIASAEKEIEAAKQAAIAELKATAGELALQVAEQLLRKELKNDAEQKRVVETLINELNVAAKN